MLSKSPFLFGAILIVITIFTRFYNLNWGSGYYFHPDENNMALSVEQMSPKNLNPNFFAYGQFPLFLTFFTTPKHQFSTIILTLRFWSAVFSSFSVLFFYLIIRQFIKNSKIIFFSVLLFIFTPGYIQSAHFGTTESILIFVFLINIYLSLKFLKQPKSIYFVLSSLVSGIGLATKISSLILVFPILLSLFFSLLKDKKIFRFIFSIFLFSSLTFLIGYIFSPYSLLNFSEFKLSMIYEIGVANGSIPVFYTRQFLNTIPYLFQFKNIFPYTNGLPILFCSLISIYLIFKSFFINQKLNLKLLLVLIPCLVFFLYQGQLFVKWTRFMAPIFFIFPFLAALFLNKIKNNILIFLITIICIVPGIIFLQRYFISDIRVQASEWINQNIPRQSKVLSESGNVINLPLGQNNLEVNNFDFYQLDENLDNQNKLNSLIKTSDYIFVPSRRVFKNQSNPEFPTSQQYYQNLFSKRLNFSLIKTFSFKNSFLLDPENAEETWTVFDNPTIRIFKKNIDEK